MKAIVLVGAGGKFCGGADITRFPKLQSDSVSAGGEATGGRWAGFCTRDAGGWLGSFTSAFSAHGLSPRLLVALFSCSPRPSRWPNSTASSMRVRPLFPPPSEIGLLAQACLALVPPGSLAPPPSLPPPLHPQYEAGKFEGDTFVAGNNVDYIEPLKHAFREKRFIVREFAYDAAKVRPSLSFSASLQPSEPFIQWLCRLFHPFLPGETVQTAPCACVSPHIHPHHHHQPPPFTPHHSPLTHPFVFSYAATHRTHLSPAAWTDSFPPPPQRFNRCAEPLYCPPCPAWKHARSCVQAGQVRRAPLLPSHPALPGRPPHPLYIYPSAAQVHQTIVPL